MSAFYGCSVLPSITLPKCKSLYATFYNCSSLSIASFPECNYIGSSTFSNCWNLLSLYLLSTSVATLINSAVFTSTPVAGYTTYTNGVYGSIYVPMSLLDQYKAATNWSFFSSRFVGVSWGGESHCLEFLRMMSIIMQSPQRFEQNSACRKLINRRKCHPQ